MTAPAVPGSLAVGAGSCRVSAQMAVAATSRTTRPTRIGSSQERRFSGVVRGRRRGHYGLVHGRRPCGQVLAHSSHRPAVGWIGGHRDLEQVGGPASPGQPRWRFVHDAVHRRQDAVGGVVRRPTRQRLVERRAQRPHVARLGRRLASGHLGSQVRRRAGHGSGHRDGRVSGTRDAEVGQLGGAVGGDQDVGRLDVPVHDARRVCRGKSLGHLREQGRGLGRRQAAVVGGDGGEVSTSDVLHDEPLLVTFGDEVEDSDDVRMVEPGSEPGLPLGAHQVERAAVREHAEPLDGDLAAEHLVDGEPDCPHAALADLALQEVAPSDQRGTGRRHRRPTVSCARGAHPARREAHNTDSSAACCEHFPLGIADESG